jgi:hypothetical protein
MTAHPPDPRRDASGRIPADGPRNAVSGSSGPRDRAGRIGRDRDPLESLLAAALRPAADSEVAPRDLAARITALTVADLRRAAAADRSVARRLEAELVPAAVVPSDLETRVHAASVSGLPAPAVLTGPWPGTRRGGAAARTLVGRLAMAASFGVLAFAGWWTTRPPAGPPAPRPVEAVLASGTANLEDLSWASLDEVHAIESELALLEDWDVGSYADVAGEIESMIPDFLMIDPGE